VTVEIEKKPTTAKHNYAGVDYIRLTASDHAPLAAWSAICLPEYIREERAGRKSHMRWILGYWGRVGEHCFVGERDDGCMIQLSGAYAWQRWYDAGLHSKKCTRIDLQVTWPLDGDPGQYIRDMYEVGKLAKKREGHQPELTLTDTPEGAKMLTVGSRQSTVYGRMYDKGRESRMPEYANHVRWEIEVKAEPAIDLNAHLRAGDGPGAETCAIVHNWWSQRGMTPFWDPFEGIGGIPPMKRSKTDETKIAWLATQVAPTLTTLKSHGRLVEAVRALFKDCLTEKQLEDLLLSLYQESDG